jgi:hypothetical protein
MGNQEIWRTHCILYGCIAIAEQLEESGADAAELVAMLKVVDENLRVLEGRLSKCSKSPEEVANVQ